MWELPRLAAVTEPQPAIRCNDWLHRIQPSINDLAPKAYLWWQYVMKEARDAYNRWCCASPLERAHERGEPSDLLKGERFVRLESRTLAMLSKALPASIYELALSSRNTSCVGLIYITLKTFQTGGLLERSELLRGLTTLPTAQNATSGVSTIQDWFRHLDRARNMGVAIPDCSLLIDGLDKMSTSLLDKHPNLLFRMHSIRMQLRLDTVPSMQAVEPWARSLLAQMETLAISGVDSGANKRNRVASVTDKNPKEPAISHPKSEPKKAEVTTKDACKHWATDTGCKRGRSCGFSHALEKPGRCWVCGGAHQKVDCHAPGGGKGPIPEGKGKARPSANPKEHTSKGSGKTVPQSAPASTPEATAAIKEATQFLQSLRLAKVQATDLSLKQIKRLAEADGSCGLIDGGATACLRTALPGEDQFPTVDVQLATGECKLHVNPAGTLLSPTAVAPIVSVSALIKLGYSMSWSDQRCDISHPVHGRLEVDLSSGCPEVAVDVAIDLIKRYETLVSGRQAREDRIRRLMIDMRSMSDDQLTEVLRSENSEAEGALRVLLGRRFDHVPPEILEQLVTPVQEVTESRTWNRKARRRQSKASGLLVHAFCGESRTAFEDTANKLNLAHIPVDVKEDLLRQSTYQHLLLQAVRGRIRLLVGGPPCRTFSICRYFPLQGKYTGPRPVRIRGESICTMNHEELSGAEVAMRQVDDLLFLRFLTLLCVSCECNRSAGIPDPGFGLEQPEDPEDWGTRGSDLSPNPELTKLRPKDGFASFWSSPEWKKVLQTYNLHVVSFDQGPLLHTKRKPTSLGTNMRPAAELVGCGGPGTESWQEQPQSILVSKSWAEWSPGLKASLGYMMMEWCSEGNITASKKLRKLDPGFIEHIKQQHVPYRRDCKYCIQGGAKQRAHRRILTPQAWTLSVDTTGPFVRAQDEMSKAARYLAVGVLTVPRLIAESLKPEADGEPEGEADEEAQDAASEHPDVAADVLEAADWIVDVDAELEKEYAAPPKEDAATKEAWTKWSELVEADQAAWKAEAQQHHLPKVEMVDWVFVEPVPSKSSSEILNAVGRMYAAARSEGFDVRRVHSDRGREFMNSQMRSWCSRHGLHKTYSIAEEHQSNGRVEGTIQRVKCKVRTILQEAACGPEEWPLAARLAGHALRNRARSKLCMKLQPSIPYNSKVQILQRSWNRGVWESLTTTAHTKSPSGDSTRGWIVKTCDGKLLTTGTIFPAPSDQQNLDITCRGDPVPVSEPERRLRGKTALKALCYITDGTPRHTAHELERLAQKNLQTGNASVEEVIRVIQLLQQTCTRNQLGESWKGKFGVVEQSGTVGIGILSQEYPWLTRYINIPNEVVKTEMSRWKPSMQAEYDSLVHETKAVRPLTDDQFTDLVKNPNIQHELVPGRAIFTVKAHSGRLKTRIVACGCFQTSAARSREDKHASGVSAESTRMLLRFAGLQGLKVGVLDIKTAFLHAPVVTPNQETVIVRVPAILRASGICTEKYWRVDKALYGLDVAPRSWVLHRNRVLSAMDVLSQSSRRVRCFPLEEDANVWCVVDASSDESLAYLALYVDDILIVSDAESAGEIACTLESKWTTTPVTWVEPGISAVFDGFEIDHLDSGQYIVHQRSYIRELLKQYDRVQGVSNVPCTKDAPALESNESVQELIRQAQGLTGQLLWLSGRTRPDIAYAVSVMGQGIMQDPASTVSRGYHLVKYLRHAPDIGLEYGEAPETYGQWGQLQLKQTKGEIDLYSDASFLADSESRSIGCSQMFWAGSLVMWHCGRQALLSASTAEAELISMAEAFGMGRSLRPFVEALCASIGVSCRATLYADNAAAIQLCTLDAGSWRTRHLRLRGNIIRQAVDRGEWSIAHLEGVYMPADIGTKPVGPSRFEDLIGIMSLHCPKLSSQPRGPPNPKVAALKTGVTRLLIALMLFNQASPAKAAGTLDDTVNHMLHQVGVGILYGIGGYIGWSFASSVHRRAKQWLCPRRPMTVGHRIGPRINPVRENSQGHGNLLDLPNHTSGLELSIQSVGLDLTYPLSNLEAPAQAEGMRSPAHAGGTRSPAQAEGMRSPAHAGGTRSPAQAEGTRSHAQAEGMRSPAQAEGTRSPVQAEGMSSPAHAGGTRSPAQAEGMRSPAQAEGTRSPAQAEGTRSPAQAEGMRSPAHAGGTRSPAQAEGMRSATQAEGTRSPAQAEGMIEVACTCRRYEVAETSRRYEFASASRRYEVACYK